MIPLKIRTIFARILLMSAMVCFVSITVCSTRAMAVQSVGNDGEKPAVACCQEQAAPEAASAQGGRLDDSCACKALKGVSAHSAAIFQAPAISHGAIFYDPCRNEFTFEPAQAVALRKTGPPRRWSLAELILQHGHFSHAPPLAA